MSLVVNLVQCFALRCVKEIRPGKHGCSRHWKMVSKPMKMTLKKEFRPNSDGDDQSEGYKAALEMITSSVDANERGVF